MRNEKCRMRNEDNERKGCDDTKFICSWTWTYKSCEIHLMTWNSRHSPSFLSTFFYSFSTYFDRKVLNIFLAFGSEGWGVGKRGGCRVDEKIFEIFKCIFVDAEFDFYSLNINCIIKTTSARSQSSGNKEQN